MHFEFENHLSCILASGGYVDNTTTASLFEFAAMEHPVKMRDLFIPRSIQFIDEGFSEIDNESTMSLDLNTVDYQVQDGKIYDDEDEDDAYSWSDDEWDDSSVELYSITSPYSQEEAERLELMHLIFTMTAHGFLHLAPIKWHPQRILDIGCGTGTWCIGMADAYPSAEVVGVELSPSQPILVPPNLTFRIDEFDDEWTYSRSFDYIHARLLAGRIRDWPKLMRQCFENCSSGGWIEFQDIYPLFESQHGPTSQNTVLVGEVMYPGPFLAQWMHEAGFINIRVVKRSQPVTSYEDVKLVRLYSESDEEKRETDQLLEWQTDISSETQCHEQLSTSLKSFVNSACWNRDQQNTSRDGLMSDGIRASPVSMDLYTIYGQKP